MSFEAQFVNKNTDNKIKKNKKNRITILILYLIILLIFLYFSTPILNPSFKSGYILFFFNIFFLIFIMFSDKFNNVKFKKYFINSIFIVFIIYIFLLIISSPIVRSNDYYSLIGNVEKVNYNEQKPNISNEIIPIVDYELAQKLGDKVLGEELGLGSQYDIGEYYLISTKDDLAWVAPLEPQNFWKWMQNKGSIPGYIYVSATNPNDVRLVQEINGQKIQIKYSEKSFFNDNIKRYTYLNGNAFKGLTDFSFEIDDNGYPYWVVTTYAPKIGFDGYDATGVITIDAQTGDISSYTIGEDEIPNWIDRIYPKNMIQQQLEYYGAYKDGWINTVTTQKEMIQPTTNLSYVFIDDEPYYYSGMTSIKSDESTVGFIVTNIKDKSSIFYSLNGATESAAQSSAQGKVQQFNYSASIPILLNIYNKPTYFMTLKDNDGLVKQYAFVSVENYNIVGIGDSVDSAKKDYYNQLKNNDVLSKDDVDKKEVNGSIERINYFDNFFYIKLINDDNIYSLDKDLSKDLILTQKEDKVKMEYINDDNDYKQVVSFENLTF